jgi:RNA polymerase sigma-70 factor (ECF subfamily)
LLNEDIEQEIVSSAQQTPESFGLLYDHYFPKIYNYIYHRVRNTQLAEDLVSETFYKALANIQKFKWRERSFACWLYTIARNQIVDTYRKTTPVLLDESWAEGLPSTGDDPEEKVMQDAVKKELLLIIRTLSQDQQDALLLRFQEGLKIKEIALIMDRNEGAVKALLFRGLKNMRKKMEGGT